MELYRHTLPKARKSHCCKYCGKEIAIGDVYSCESGKFEGEMFTRKMDLICYAMMTAFCDETSCYEFDWDDVNDYLQDKHCCSCEKKDNCDYFVNECPDIRNFYDAKGKSNG